MDGRNLLDPEAPVGSEPTAGRNLLAEEETGTVSPEATSAPVPSTTPASASMAVEVPDASSQKPAMRDLFDKYSKGEMGPVQAAAFEELAKRRLSAGEQLESKGIGVLREVGNTAVRTGKLAADAAAALPGSTLHILNELGKAFMSPVQTTNALGKLAFGTVEQVIPGEQSHEEHFDTLVDSFKQKYGSLEALNEVIAKDPASVLLDMSAVLTGGGMAASKVPVLANAGKAMRAAGDIIDPMQIAAKAAVKTSEVGGKAVDRLLGAATGEGAEAIRQAKVGAGLTSESSGFVAGMRGKTAGEDLLADAGEALITVKANKGTEYRKTLEEISKDKTVFDLRPIKDRLSKQMTNFGIRVNKKGELDFSRSSINRDAQSDVAKLIEDVSGWGTQAGDNTAIGLDLLKRNLDDFYSDSKNSRALVTDLRNTVKNEIVSKVPEYAKMTKDYEEITRLTNEMERALSLGKRSMMDTALRKLTSTTKDNFEFRHKLVSELERLSGRSLAQEIAGLNMSKVKPRSLLSSGATAGAVAAGFVSPWFLSMAAVTSPRIMGEFLNALGFTSKQANKAVTQLKRTGAFKPAPRQAAALIGRTTSEGDKDE